MTCLLTQPDAITVTFSWIFTVTCLLTQSEQKEWEHLSITSISSTGFDNGIDFDRWRHDIACRPRSDEGGH
ncbi:hypothetical protein U1Q18_041323 [Sarracenia purpurea var. burkii]